MLPETGADDITKSQTSQGAPLQRSFLGAVYDYTLGVLEPWNPLAAKKTDETEGDRSAGSAAPKPVTKGETSKGAHRSLSYFLQHINGKFTCTRQGKPCMALEGETLKGMVVLIGLRHEDEGEAMTRQLIARFRKPEDQVLAELSPSEFEHNDRHRTHTCMGAPREACIPGELEGVKTAADDKITELARLKHARLSVVDPRGAEEFARLAEPIGAFRAMDWLDAKFAEARRTRSFTNEERARIRDIEQRIDATTKEVSTLVDEKVEYRDQNYIRQVEELMGDQERTIYVPLGRSHVRTLQAHFADNPRVIVLVPSHLA
jgi:hypothetical protein